MLRHLITQEAGSVAVYSAFVGMMLIGSAALVVDYGRGIVVKQQLQNYADSAAAAGASYLDGSDGARERAMTVVNNTISKQSGISNSGAEFTIVNFAFYSSLSPKTLASSDQNAKYLSVTTASETVDYFFAPVLELMSGEETDDNAVLSASATASGNPLACHVPPLMVCDYSETMGSNYDLRSPLNVGKQIRIGKASGLNRLAPGNFGILDTPSGSQGTQDIAKAMAAIEPEGCYSSDAIDTAPGARVDAIRDGINSRFDKPEPPHHFADPAPNVVNYPRDEKMNANVLGDGEWDVAAYWQANHPGISMPAELPPSPSRYQVYLYELNETFAYNGKKTVYPVDEESIPAGYTLLEPTNSPGVPNGAFSMASKGNSNAAKSSASSNDCKGNSKKCDDADTGGGDSGDTSAAQNGNPVNNTPVDDPRRRVIEVVMLNCNADNVKGNGGPYNSNGKYFEMFVTEYVDKDHTIYGEIVRGITPGNSNKLHANISLNE